jgi:hypothetical protein
MPEGYNQKPMLGNAPFALSRRLPAASRQQ